MKSFYEKHLPDGHSVQHIIHQHWTSVIDMFILWLSFWAVFPSIVYLFSYRVQELVPLYALQLLLLLVFLKTIYELFNWYHDVWIISEYALYDLKWSLLKTRLESLHYENIEWVEIIKDRILDKFFRKWDIVVHKFGEETLTFINAEAPKRAISLMEQFIHPPKEEKDRFELLMSTLSWVLWDYIEEKWIQEPGQAPKERSFPAMDDYTVDLR